MSIVSRKQPLYDQLVDALRGKIESELGPGDILPSERELAEAYGLSRTTVRKALDEMESLGLVARRQGRGTFVAESSREATDLMHAYSFTDQMRRMGRTPRTEVLEFGIVEAPRQVAENLGLRLGERVYRMRRLRLADEVPMMVETSYLPASEFVALSKHDVDTKPLYDIIEKDYHEKIRVAVEEFRASTARLEDARSLGIAEGSPVLELTRLTHNDQNMVIEFTHSVARADQFKYRVIHHRS